MARIIAPLAPVALVLFSAMVYQASASSMASANNAQAEAAGVQSLVTANCRPENPSSRIYDLVGIDTRTAGGIVVRHPERLREVCNIVNRSLTAVSLRELGKSRSMKDMGSERADNSRLHALAESLDLSADDATVLVRKHGQDVLAKRMPDAASTPVPATASSVSVVPSGLTKTSSTNLGLHYAPQSPDTDSPGL